MAQLDIQNRLEGDALIISFNGEIDKSTIESVKRTLPALVEQNAAAVRVIFDMTNLTFINSEGIGNVMAIHTSLTKKERKVIMVGLQPNVKDVFELIGLTKLIPTYPDLPSALGAAK